ncbi:MAG: hypothetical protein A2X37_09485 [Elusimicrobia bacterium GWA2_66_18]|nr:MAG: hypothetical protein A2X37_09485 [Elusimicrobia bacterium GWA2_66_18]
MRAAETTASILFCVLSASFLGLGSIRSTCATYDEPVHLAAGYTDLVQGRYRLNAMDHPPLAEMWAALPLLALRPNRFSDHPAWLDGRVYHYGDLFLYKNRVPAERLLGAARIWNLATLTALLACALVLWARRLEGAPAAWGAAGALGFCVPWFSNAALVTTDGLSTALFFATCALLASPRRTPLIWAMAGAAAGAALAAKFNMILLPVLVGCALAAEARMDLSRRPRPGELALFFAAALLALAAAYRFTFVGLYAGGLSATLSRLSEGRGAYLHGRYSDSGWLWYFPAAVLVKTPLALLALGGLGAWASLRRPCAQAAWLFLPPLGYFLAALTSKTQIGYRHVLPFYPFLCLWAGLGAARLWDLGAKGRAVLAAAGLWLAVSVGRNHPRHLSYFNEFVRSGRGHDWLADSNLDWGQDLPALARELALRGNPPLVLSYFGSADPQAHGLRYVPLLFMTNTERAGNASLDPRGALLFAVSVTNLLGVYFRDHALLAWLRDRRPVALCGGSIFLYDLTADREGRARLADLLAASGRPGDARVAAGR